MQALINSAPQNNNPLRNSLGWRDLFAYAFTDVVFSHNNSRMTKLIPCLPDISARLCLISASFCSQVTHLEVGLFNSRRFSRRIKPPSQHAGGHRLAVIHNN